MRASSATPLPGCDQTSKTSAWRAIAPRPSPRVPALEKPSQNQIAEALYKAVGLERTGVGTADSGRAVVERQLREWGADTTGFVVRDGSGLSRHDYLSPETIVRVLDAMRRIDSRRRRRCGETALVAVEAGRRGRGRRRFKTGKGLFYSFRYSRRRRVCVRLTGISVAFASFILRM